MTRTGFAREFAREVVTGGLTALPAVNSRLSVCPVSPSADPSLGEAGAFGQVVEVPTRVEDLHLSMGDRRRASTAELIIAQPVFAGNLHGELVGTPYLLRWLNERGVHEVTGRYLGRRRVGPALIGWRMGITGPVTRIQRRAHARVTVAVPMEAVVEPPVHQDPEMPTGAVEGPVDALVCRGLTVNISEGGMLAALQPGGPVPAPGAEVLVRFVLSDEAFALPGRVVRHQPTTSIAVAFHSPNEHGDRIRPLLFAHQLNARRIGVL